MFMTTARTIEIGERVSVFSLIFLEDGRHLLGGTGNGTIRQWRVEDGVEVRDQRLTLAGGDAVRSMSLSGDRKWLISGDSVGGAIVWDRRTRQIVFTQREHTGLVNTVDVSPDSTRFTTGGEDARVFIRDIADGKRLVGPLTHARRVTGSRFSPDGNYLAVAVWESPLLIYHVANGQSLRSIAISGTGTATPIAWSSDSQRIFALSFNTIRQHQVDTGTLLSEWTVPGDRTSTWWHAIALPSNGRFIASFVGRTLTLWDISRRAQLGDVFSHGSPLCSMALSLDNNCLAIGADDGTITLRNLNDIIPLSYLVGRSVIQPIRCMFNFQPQVEALRGVLRALEVHSGDSTSTITQPNNPPQAHITPLHISNGTYRIKSTTGNAYLTCLQSTPGVVVVQQLEQTNTFQRWHIHVVDGAYSITGSSNMTLTVGIRNALVMGSRVTTWTFDSRGDAYVIGNAANATAIQLAPNRRSVTVFPRTGNSNQNQRWFLEPVTD